MRWLVFGMFHPSVFRIGFGNGCEMFPGLLLAVLENDTVIRGRGLYDTSKQSGSEGRRRKTKK